MNCEKCHKNHATIHITAAEGGVKRELHLCEERARQPKVNQVRCPECGITYSEFKTKARLGCANDYEVFRSELLRLLEKVHGSTQHAGKTPHTVDAQIRKENELIRLKRDLDSVVKSEDFEKAA